jgi:predicted RNase H-like HicB family nuclease
MNDTAIKLITGKDEEGRFFARHPDVPGLTCNAETEEGAINTLFHMLALLTPEAAKVPEPKGQA